MPAAMPPPADLAMFLSCDVVGSTAFKTQARDRDGLANWVHAFETLFRELPLIFIGQLAAAFFEEDELPESGVWKVMGDEVIFLHQGRVAERAPIGRFFPQPSSPEAAAFVKGELPWA